MHRLRLGGKGTVVTYTIIHDAPAQFELQKPYVMGIIEMDEGVRLTSQLINVKPEDVKIGMKVQATFRKLGQEGEAGVIHYGYKFRPQG
jgi:scaffold protein (connect acetoacetyl-CoA thiolase and HMG-CoA synthase)